MKQLTAFPITERLRKLGKGGTAEVYLTTLPDGRSAALKIPLEQTDELLRLAAREFELIGTLTFPGIVRLLAPADQGRLLLEYCAGPTLDEYRGKLPVADTLEIISAAAASLEFIHASGIVHADIKSQNIFIPALPDQFDFGSLWFAKFSDFSLGKKIGESDDLRLGQGTFGFMSPELLTDRKSSIASDLFAFGVMAYELLTGIHPFLRGSSDPMIVSARVCEGTVEPPSQHRADISPEVDSIILGLLEKDPSKRTQAALHVCETLHGVGVKYPFRKALHPRWFPKEMVRIPDASGLAEVERRLCVTASFRNESLRYEDQSFQLVGALRIPSRFRRRLLKKFSGMTMSEKRNRIFSALRYLAAKTGDSHSLSIGNLKHELLLQLFRPKTIRLVAQREILKLKVHGEGCTDAAYLARLNLLAGHYQDATRLGCDAATIWSEQGRSVQANTLLRLLRDEMRGTGNSTLERQLTLERAFVLRSAGSLPESEAEYLRVIDLSKSFAPDEVLADAHNGLGILYHQQEKFESGKTHLESGLSLYELFGNQLAIAKTQNNLGNLYWLVGDFNSALSHYRRALHHQRKLGADREAASTINNAATAYCMKGRFERSIRLFKTSLEQNKEMGITVEIARTLNNLGFVYHTTGRGDEAVDVLKESLSLNRRIGSQKEILFNLENLGAELFASCRLTEAEESVREGIELATAIGDTPHLAQHSLLLASIRRRQGRLQEAESLLSEILTLSHDLDSRSIELGLKYEQARLLEAVGHIDQAVQRARQLFDEARERNDEGSMINALLMLARRDGGIMSVESNARLLSGVFHARERTQCAYAALELALEANDTPRISRAMEIAAASPMVTGLEMCSTSLSLADAFIRLGKPDAALKLISRAKSSREGSQLYPERVRLEVLSATLSLERHEYDSAFASIRKGLEFAMQVVGKLSEQEKEVHQSLPLFRRLTELVGAIRSRLQKKERAG